jgi:predicted nucleotidyltransferase
MIMFGSITNSEFSEESDVDLALLANREIDKIYKGNENFIHFRKVDILS